MVSNSESPAGRCNDSMRRGWGMSTSRSSIDSTPIAASIAARSSGEWTRYGKLGRRGLREFLVRRLVEEVRGERARQLQLDDPAFTVRVRVDQLGVVFELVVDFN